MEWSVDMHKSTSDCLVEDVINTYKELVKHCPIDRPVNMKRPYPIFLCAKQKWRKFDDAWFIASPVHRSWLHLIVNKLTVSFHELKGKVLSNKIGIGLESLVWRKFLMPGNMTLKLLVAKFQSLTGSN